MMKVSGVKNLRERLPKDFLDMLYEVYTQKEVDSILISYLRGRESSFRINNIKGEKNKVIEELRERNIKINHLSNILNCYTFNRADEKKIRLLKCYKNGEIYLQNPSSILPALILEGKEGEKILDLCAAPGGKSLVISNLINNNGEIIANEVNNIRYERLKKNIIDQGATCITTTNEDGRILWKKYENYFDKVIVDAPCSGEGTILIKDSNSLKGIEKIKNTFPKKQKELLESAYKALKKSGILVYSTCTINPIENECIIDKFLKKHNDMKIVQINNLNLPYKKGITQYGGEKFTDNLINSIRIVPNEVMEGFFLCKMRKMS